MKYYNFAMKIISALLLLALIIDISIQIFARYFLPYAPSWTEEAARFILLYLVASSSGLAMQKKLFVNVDLIFQMKKMPSYISFSLKIVANIIIFISCLILGISSLSLIQIGMTQISAALLLPMSIVFITILVLPLNIIITQIHQLFSQIRR